MSSYSELRYFSDRMLVSDLRFADNSIFELLHETGRGFVNNRDAAARNQKDRGNNIKNDQEQGHALASIAALGARHVKAKVACNGKDVLVPAPTHVHANDVIRWQGWRDFHHVTQCMRRFQRGNDPFRRAAQLERL